jgi:outer membrane protein assembly factor BamB
MAAPTVVDGKIYAANDYGAIYCISTVKGKKWDGGGEIILPGGFWHWSWALLIAIAILAVIALVRFY